MGLPMMRENPIEILSKLSVLHEKLQSQTTPLTNAEANALALLNQNAHMFDWANAIDSNRITQLNQQVNAALEGKLKVEKKAPAPRPPKDPIAYIYERREEIIKRAGSDPEKLKQELKAEMAKYEVDPVNMLQKINGPSRLTEPLKSIIREEYNKEVKAFFAERTTREKLTSKDTNDNLTQNEKFQDYHHLIRQMRHIERAIKLDAQMQYGHADGEKGLKALRDNVYHRIQMVYYNKAPMPEQKADRQNEQQPQKNESKQNVKSQQTATQTPQPRVITRTEAENELKNAQKFFPDDVKNAEQLVARIKGGEQVTREQLRREEEKRQSQTMKLGSPAPTRAAPTALVNPLPQKPAKPLPQKPDAKPPEEGESTRRRRP